MLIIRKAKPSDAEKILAYCKQIGGETDQLTFGPEGISMTVEEERRYLDNIQNSDRQLYLVAECDDQIVGTCQYRGFSKARLAHRGEIALSVRRALWGRQIGTRFMSALLDFARNTAQAEIISLEVRSDNTRAIGLYRKFGFETIGTFRGYMKVRGDYVSCDIMQLFL